MAYKSKIIYLSRFGIAAAIIYCIPVIFFLKDRRFADTWLLYLGSALFLVITFAFGIIYGFPKNEDPAKVYNGFTVTILGVIASVILVLLLTLILAPDVYGIGSANDVLNHTPAAMGKGGNHSILFLMLANAAIVNFAAGAFSAVMSKGKNAENKLPPNQSNVPIHES
jgi:hypothetical protein